MAYDTFRPVVKADVRALLALNNRAVPAVNTLNDEEMIWFIDVSRVFLVADSPEGPVGFLIGLEGPGLQYLSPNYMWFSSKYEKFLYVDRVVVDPKWWGRGIGQAFYEAFVAAATGESVLCAEVNLIPRNKRSLDFHKRFGFTPIGEQSTEGGEKRVVLLEYQLKYGDS